jgi:uncharacterized protein YpmB
MKDSTKCCQLCVWITGLVLGFVLTIMLQIIQAMLLKHAARQQSSEKVKERSDIAHNTYSQLQQS